MERPSFKELKAGLERPFRTSLTLPAEPNSYIYGVNIRGQFFSDLWLSFSPHSNALIGVKGAGKTSVLECFRFVLGAPVPSSRQENVTGHLQSILGAAGNVRALIKRSDGARLLVERSLGTQGFKVIFEDDRHEVFTNPDGMMFPSYILGWHEIEQAATDPNIRQVYHDTIAGREEIRQLQEQADTAAKRIHYLHGETSNRHAAFRALNDQIVRLEELRRGLQELTDGNLIEMRDQYEAAVKHRDAVQELRRVCQEALDELETRVSSFGVKTEKAVFEGSSPLSTYALTAYDLINDIQSDLSKFSVDHRRKLLDTLKMLDALIPTIDAAFDVFFADYDSRVGALPDDKRRLLESHRRVMEDTKALPRLLLERDSQRSEVDRLLIDLVKQCEYVATCLDKQTQLREEKVKELNEQLSAFGVRLSVEPLARRSRLEELTNKYATGGKIFSEPKSFASHEKRHHRRLVKAYESLRSDLMKGFHLFFDSAEFGYFVDFFEGDDLKITFKVGKTGEEFSPIDQLSAGQRCTAVFPLLLKLREGPLIVDQPEDNLNNRHIAETIAAALSEDKRSRQIAFTSHNANLVVLTDAEHIVMFEATGSNGRAEARGFLCTSQSPITNYVIAILDGGKKALELRYRKYGALEHAG